MPQNNPWRFIGGYLPKTYIIVKGSKTPNDWSTTLLGRRRRLDKIELQNIPIPKQAINTISSSDIKKAIADPDWEKLKDTVHRIFKSVDYKTLESRVAIHYATDPGDIKSNDTCNCTGFELLHLGHKCGR